MTPSFRRFSIGYRRLHPSRQPSRLQHLDHMILTLADVLDEFLSQTSAQPPSTLMLRSMDIVVRTRILRRMDDLLVDVHNTTTETLDHRRFVMMII